MRDVCADFGAESRDFNVRGKPRSALTRRSGTSPESVSFTG